MPADGRLLRRAGALALVLLGLARPAAAQQLFGTAQVQYQHAEDVREVFFPDGSRHVVRSTSELLLKTLDVRQQSYLRQNLLMDTNLRFSEQTDPGTSDRIRTPAGTLRLIHPMFQLTAQHRPTTTRTTGSGAASVSAIDTARTVTTLKTAETTFLGHVTGPGGLQVNGTWLRQRREATESVPTQRSTLRNVRASLDRQRYSVYASAADQQNRGGPAQEVLGRQGQYGFGGLWRVAPGRTTSMVAQYDFGSSRSRPNASFTSRSTSQSAMVSGEWRPQRAFTGSANYNWRRTGTKATLTRTQTDQEGVVLGRWQPTRGASLTSGGGLRTQRTADGSPRLLEYVTAIAAGEGTVRPGWTATGSAAHTTTWDPERGTYGTQLVSGVSRMAFGPRVTLDGTISVAANGDTAAANQRWSNVWTTRLQARPLRTLQLGAGVNAQRIGPGLLRPVSVSRSGTVDVTWRPHPRADFIGNYSINETLSLPRQVTRTWSSNARMQVTDHWQLQGIYTRTATPRYVAGVNSQVTRDLATGRVLWQPTRNVATSVSLTTNDPGTDLEGRRIDGTFTWSFGR